MDDQGGPSATSGSGLAKDKDKDKETVKVVVRCRPLFGKEIVEGRKPIVTIDTQASIVSIKCPENDQVKPFTFDSVYDETTSQRQFYDESAYPLVESIFDGYNGTIFAYGQTGCGKTHTMQGKDSPPELRGVIPLSFDHIFESISADPSREYMVRASYLEIYNEDIRDLLSDDSKKKLELKESADGSVYVKDLTEVVVSDVDSINRVMSRGFKNRTVGATLMNEGSSRSHSIFTVVVETSQKIEGQEHFKAGKLNLVDLAGSERQSKTGATGNRLKEGCKINLSLSALGNVISALVDGKGKHIPYRDSKLTRLLQDSLGGNTKTLMVAAVSPADYNYDETLSTLRYANRAKNIKNKPIVNEDPKDAKLREYKEEIERLKKMLETQSRGSALGSASGMSTPRTDATPSRSALSSPENATRESASANDITDQALVKEREEIAKYQREAAEMLERAKRMMAEAKALQEAQQQERASSASALQTDAPTHEELSIATSTQPQPSPQSPAGEIDPARPATERSSGAPNSAADLAQPLKPAPPTESAPIPSSNAATAPLLGSLPPLKTPRAKQLSRPDVLAELSAEKREQLLRQDSKSEAAPLPSPRVVAPSPSIPSKADDDAIAKAMGEAARVDAQAKEMMARAEQMMRDAEQRALEAAHRVTIVKEVVVKEVIPDHHVREQAELKEFNQTILDQRDRIGVELAKTQQAMEAYMKEKQALHAKLQKIESQILGGTPSRRGTGASSSDPSAPDSGHGRARPLVDSEVALLQQQVEYRRTQIKLKEKVKKEAQTEAARKALALEKQQIEVELKTAQEAAQASLAAAKKKESKYRSKLETARQEIVDLTSEFERERENLLDTIREQTKETKLLEQLVELFLPQNELVKVWERAVWIDEREEWTLPKLKPRSDFQKIKLPTLHLPGTHANGASVGSNTGAESGGAEVVSDDDCGAGAAPTGGGNSTVRSSCSSASSSKRRKPSLKDPLVASSSSSSASYYAGAATSKPSSSTEATMFTTRGDDLNVFPSSFLPSYGGVAGTNSSGSASYATTSSHHPPPMHSSRVLSPENGRLPSALRSSRYDPPNDELVVESSSHHKSSSSSSKRAAGSSVATATTSSGSRERKRSKEHREKDRQGATSSLLPPTNNEGRSPQANASEKFFPSEDDLLTPLASEYQPRDRLQSRKGSRQGSRGGDATASSSSSSAGQSGMSEFDFPLPADRSSRGPTSSSTSSGSRRHRERHDDAHRDDLLAGSALDDIDSVNGASRKEKKSSSSSSSKHKKKREKKDKHAAAASTHSAVDVDPYDDFDVPDLQFDRAPVQSPEDADYYYESER